MTTATMLPPIEAPRTIPLATDPAPDKANGAPDVERLLSDLAEANRHRTEARNLAAKIGDLQQKMLKKEGDMEAARGDLKALEKERDRLVNELLVVEGGRGQPNLPFPLAAAAQSLTPDEKDKADFDRASLTQIGVTGKLADKLEADGIRTGADLQKWFADHPPRKIAGVGDAQRDKVNELMAGWFESRRKEREAEAAKKAAEKPAGAAGPEAAAPAAGTFDDEAIDPETVETIIGSEGRYEIKIARRAGGRWAQSHLAAFGSHKRTHDFEGHYESRVAAIEAAADQVHDFVRSKQAKGKAKEQAAEIVRALDKLDKKLVAEAKAAGAK